MHRQKKKREALASQPAAASSQNIGKTVAILQKILDKHEKNGSIDPSTLQHLQHVQAVVDKLQSPLFSSLVEIHSKYKEGLANPRPAATRPQSTALELSARPELLPQFCQRYGISDIAAATSAAEKLSSPTGASPGLSSLPQKKGKVDIRSIKTSGSTTPTSFISGSGRLLPLLRKESPKSSSKGVGLGDLVNKSFLGEEQELREMETRGGSRIAPSSTESSLSSMASSEAPSSQGKSSLLQVKSTPASGQSRSQTTNLIISNHQVQEDNEGASPNDVHQGSKVSEEEVVLVPNVAFSEQNQDHQAIDNVLCLEWDEDHQAVDSFYKWNEDHQAVEYISEDKQASENTLVLEQNEDHPAAENKSFLEENKDHQVIENTSFLEQNEEHLASENDSFLEWNEDHRAVESGRSFSVPAQAGAVVEGGVSPVKTSSAEISSAKESLLESKAKASSLPSEPHQTEDVGRENGGLPSNQDGQQLLSYSSVLRNKEDFGEALSSISEELLDEDENNEACASSVNNKLGGGENSPSEMVGKGKTVSIEGTSSERKDSLHERHSQGQEGEVEVGRDNSELEEVFGGHDGQGELKKEEDASVSEETGEVAVASGGDVTSGDAKDLNSAIVGKDSGSAATKTPRDMLFFMRDKRSQSELTGVLKRIDKAPRIVPITVGSPAVGGARRVGLELIGLSSTGVFIDEVSADRGDLRKGDQVLQVDDQPVDGMASFEVDLLLREAASGQEIIFQVLYNPTGYSECLRTMKNQSL